MCNKYENRKKVKSSEDLMSLKKNIDALLIKNTLCLDAISFGDLRIHENCLHFLHIEELKTASKILEERLNAIRNS